MKKFKLKNNKDAFLINLIRGTLNISVSSLLLHSVNPTISSFVWSQNIHADVPGRVLICHYISQSIILSNKQTKEIK